jgi:hypothetical protein
MPARFLNGDCGFVRGTRSSTSGSAWAVDTRRSRNHTRGRRVQQSVDDEERQALHDDGLDPDDPAVIAAIDLVRWELSLGT